LVEEPESFLHPSAQAEFGQVLNNLADELSIQIIATTHSPYMLNQREPTANFLLERRVYRGALRDTVIKKTDGENWMLPFSENLGIVPSEFSAWESVFRANSGKVVFVEGSIDKAYFQHFKENYEDIYDIPEDVEIVSYDGSGALKNTSILQFMVEKFSRVFITYDLDCEKDAKSSLEKIGLEPQKDFCAIGKQTPGCENIEGLLPAEVKRAVYASEHETVAALTSHDSKNRNSAKSKLKQDLLSEFKKRRIDCKELSDFRRLFQTIRKAFT
jgi:putative ATP-dependent endonuclease of the OLD family